MRCAERIAAALVGIALATAGGGMVAHSLPLEDRPIVWHEDDRRPIPEPSEREPSLVWDYFDDSLFLPLQRALDPGRGVRRIGSLFGGDHMPAAHNVNRLDEVPNSSWFTNRIGLFPRSPDDVARGPGPGTGPDRGGPWTIISAKTQGVTPGFNIEDAAGDRFLIKFDPPDFPGMTIGAGAICTRLLHAAGYNVPDDVVVRFRREELRLGDGVKIRDDSGTKRPMTIEDIDAILDRVTPADDGSYRAISSRFLAGKPIGPFDYRGKRKDDPNDRIAHQHRRELRGLRIFAAWILHFDTKQHNSLDVYTTDGYVRHYLIDFASTLGTGRKGPTPRYGRELTVDLAAVGRRVGGLGFWEDPWRRVRRPGGLREVAYFGSAEFDPLAFDPLQPNSAFVNLTDRDGYWAAKIISAFDDEQLEAICRQARYEDPRAGDYVARTLGERRDIIARTFFDRVPPLDFFAWEGDALVFRDLGEERGVYPGTQPRYRVRLASLDSKGGVQQETEWLAADAPRLDLATAGLPMDGEFLRLECQVHRGQGWSGSAQATFSTRHRRVLEVTR